MSDIPIHDRLIRERLGREPAEFEGYDIWDGPQEAEEAYARGVRSQ